MYEDEYHSSGTVIAYDGELLPAEDVLARYERDEQIQEKYEEAEENVDDLQMTFEDVKDKLSRDAPMHDPRAGNVGATKPGSYR